jgi:hypothetical protein
MATWTNVSSTVLEPGDPIRSVDIIAIKENIIALSEGASGAPKIQLAALQNGIVLDATASATAGAVGTYVFAEHKADVGFGSTVAGSNLQPSGMVTVVFTTYTNDNAPDTRTTGVNSGSFLSGTWRCMGVLSNATVSGTNSAGTATLLLRIA